jgi:hypothetical protein
MRNTLTLRATLYLIVIVGTIAAVLVKLVVGKETETVAAHNSTIVYEDGQEMKIYEEYPYRRLNDLNTHYVMKHGNEIYIEKVVDVTTGNVYFLTMSDKYGSAVSISPVYDSEGKIMNISPSKKE